MGGVFLLRWEFGCGFVGGGWKERERKRGRGREVREKGVECSDLSALRVLEKRALADDHVR